MNDVGYNNRILSHDNNKQRVQEQQPLDLYLNNSFYSTDNNLHHLQRDIAQDMNYIPNPSSLPLDFVERIKLLLRQYDMMLQLLIQNLLLTNDNNLKYRCYYMIYSFYLARCRILSVWKFPSFDINFRFCRVRLF